MTNPNLRRLVEGKKKLPSKTRGQKGKDETARRDAERRTNKFKRQRTKGKGDGSKKKKGKVA